MQDTSHRRLRINTLRSCTASRSRLIEWWVCVKHSRFAHSYLTFLNFATQGFQVLFGVTGILAANLEHLKILCLYEGLYILNICFFVFSVFGYVVLCGSVCVHVAVCTRVCTGLCVTAVQVTLCFYFHFHKGRLFCKIQN